MHPHERRDPHHPLRRVKDYRPDGTRRRTWYAPERSYRLTYRRRPITTLLSTILAIVLPATLVVAATQLGTGLQAPENKRPVTQTLPWKWSDGSTEAHRVFVASDYKGGGGLPHLDLSVPPGSDELISLQFLQDGEWNDEWLTKANAKGTANVPLDPFCENNTWCDGSYRYRLKMGQSVAYLDIEYWER